MGRATGRAWSGGWVGGKKEEREDEVEVTAPGELGLRGAKKLAPFIWPAKWIFAGSGPELEDPEIGDPEVGDPALWLGTASTASASAVTRRRRGCRAGASCSVPLARSPTAHSYYGARIGVCFRESGEGSFP
jgi:hypothetical protein